MSIDREQDVRNFNRGIGRAMPDEPSMPSGKELDLHLNMLGAEFTELIFALTGQNVETSPRISHAKEAMKKLIFAMMDPESTMYRSDGADATSVARQICDIHYVLTSTSLVFGVPEQAVWDEIHKANMAKIGGPKRGDGKQLPPRGWEPPDVARVFEEKFGNPLIPRPYRKDQ